MPATMIPQGGNEVVGVKRASIFQGGGLTEKLLKVLVSFTLALLLVPLLPLSVFADELSGDNPSEGNPSLNSENTDIEAEIKLLEGTNDDILLSEAEPAISLAAANPESDFVFSVSDGSSGYGAYVYGLTDWGLKNVVVPATLGGKSVVDISLYAPTFNTHELEGLDVSRCVALKKLACPGYQLTILDVSKNVNLEELYCGDNQLKSLDVSKNVKLRGLGCQFNQLATLDVSKNVNLEELPCDGNQLKSLDVSKNVKLRALGCQFNQLATLDVSKNVNLAYLFCDDNQLKSLDVSKNVNLAYLNCSSNQLTILDVSKNVNLAYLNCGDNLITDTSKLTAWLAQYGHYGIVLPQKTSSAPVAPAITTTSLAGGTVGVSYSQKLAASGTTPITWTVSTGALPKGLELKPDGTISGKPTTAGTVTFTVKAANSAGSVTKQLSIKIVAAPVKPAITTSSLADATVGKSYSQKLAATGDATITWTLSSGALPKGLTLASNGTISGTPTAAGTATFTVKAANSAGSVTKQLSIKVVAASTTTATKPAITTTSLAGGTIAKAYSQKLAATGTAPITWTLSSGSLPKGLKLATDGTISGTPTAAGTSTFTVKATNAGGSVTKELSIKIARGTVSVAYSTHVQSVGWQAAAKDGAVSGTSGRSLRLEGLKVNLTNTTGYAGGISYSTHIQSIGWQKAAAVTTTGTSATQAKGTLSGTEGRALRLEAMTMTLTGDLAKHYDIYYRVHAQNVGWMGWAKNGEPAGTAGHGFRLEALQVVLVAKNAAAPANAYKNVTTAAGTPRMIDPKPAAGTTLGYSATVHIQSVGDKSYSSATNSTILGTSGKGLRLEAMTLKLKNAPYSGSIKYETHIQSIGWQAAKTDGGKSGTSGRGLRLEALRISLTGDMGKNCDIYYRTHIQNKGWTGWAKNGQSCGSAGYGYRMEAMQIVIVYKGEVAPGLNSNYFYQKKK